jgi:cytochrome c-type biogenesis protein CcmH
VTPRTIVGTLLVLLALAAPAAAQQSATPVNDKEAYEIAVKLRCVVCQNLSVADSPSEMAQQMRQIVRDRLAMGERPDQVVKYFVDRYGEWILLAPPRRGFTLLVWVFPYIAVAVGLGVVAVIVTRWRRQAIAVTSQPRPATDPATRARIQREIDAEDL